MSTATLELSDEEGGFTFQGDAEALRVFISEQLQQITVIHGEVQGALSILGTGNNPYGDEVAALQTAANRLTGKEGDDLQSSARDTIFELTKLVRSQKLVLPSSEIGKRISRLKTGVEKGLAKETRALDGQVQVKTNNLRGANAPWFSALLHASLAVAPLRPADFGIDDSAVQQRHRDLDDLAKSLSEKIKAADAASSELQALNSVLHEKIVTAEPREFWNSYAAAQDKSSKRSFLTFLAVCCALPPLILAWMTEGVPALESAMSVVTGTPVPNLPAIASYVLIAVPVILGLWVLRFFAKSFAQAISLRADAQHRVAMVETFLSLMASKRFEPDPREREIVLQALFRPGPGDAPDVTPHESFTNAIAQIVRAK